MRAIRKLLHWIWAGLDGLRKILHLLLLLLVFGVIGAVFSRPIPLVPDRAALVIAPLGSPGRTVVGRSARARHRRDPAPGSDRDAAA